MNITNDSPEAKTHESLPNSKKVFVQGRLHADIRVPFREIQLAPTKSMNDEIEVNEPVRVYDTSGPWGDPDFRGDVTRGLPPLRAKWIRDRADVEEYEGRVVRPIDDGYLSVSHAERSAKRNGNSEFGIRNSEFSKGARVFSFRIPDSALRICSRVAMNSISGVMIPCRA